MTEKCSDCGNEEKNENVISFSKKKWGKIVCYKCQKKDEKKEEASKEEKKEEAEPGTVRESKTDVLIVRQVCVKVATELICAFIPSAGDSANAPDAVKKIKEIADSLEEHIFR